MKLLIHLTTFGDRTKARCDASALFLTDLGMKVTCQRCRAFLDYSPPKPTRPSSIPAQPA